MVRNIVLGSIALGIIAVIVWLNPFEWKMQSGLQVMTNGVPASLFLDGEYLDKSPYINKKIRPKEYLLRIEPDSAEYAPYEVPVTLYKGSVTVVNWKPGRTLETNGGVVYEMERIGRTGGTQLVFHTIPDGAIITLDGGEKQFSPLILNDLTEGDHTFEISLPSYQTHQHSVYVERGHRITVTAVLGKIDGESGEEQVTTPVQTDPTPLLDSEPTGPLVQIVSTNFFFNGQEVLRVRDAPSPAGRELGFAPVGNTYPYLSEATGWFQIEFDGVPGWVSAQFSQKIATESSQPAP